MFSWIHFPVWPYPPKIMEKKVFYTGKLYGLTGMASGQMYQLLFCSTGSQRGRETERVCVCVCSRWGREQGVCCYSSSSSIDGCVSDQLQ